MMMCSAGMSNMWHSRKLYVPEISLTDRTTDPASVSAVDGLLFSRPGGLERTRTPGSRN